MKIHEFQAKAIFSRYGLPIPRGYPATTPEETYQAAVNLENMGVEQFVIKAQIHAGGRGKAGGIRKTSSPEEARDIASSILGHPLVTHQTGPEGKIVRHVLVEESTPIDAEYYVAVVLDRARKLPVFMASAEGGVEIEEVAAHHPQAILKEHLWNPHRLLPFQGRRLAARLGLQNEIAKSFASIAQKIVEIFWNTDASLVEINPLIRSGEHLIALDAKITFDDNALYRHKDLAELRDIEEEDPYEVKASAARLNYIRLDGNIGCMVNGAGLAMATMDIIKLAGGEPANFLDVGGGASKDQIAEAFRILTSDPRVKAVLINIFGGILRVDRLAHGLVEAAREVDLHVPMVIRVEGTNVDEGRRILAASSLNFTVARDMREAAEKVVQLAQSAVSGG